VVITVQRTISMGHRLPSYDGICASPHGHNVRVVVDISPRFGFLDFKRVDAVLDAVLEPYDHAMCLQASDPLLDFCLAQNWRVVPLPWEPTTEAIARELYKTLAASLQEDGTVVKLTVHETDKYSATVFEHGRL